MLKDKKIIILIVIAIILVFILISIRQQEEVIVEKKEVLVYFSTKDAMYLTAEERFVTSDYLYENTIKELIKGPQTSSLSPTIPDRVELISIEIEDNLAYLNFNQALVKNHWGGSAGESLTVYSIVNTMVQFAEIAEVIILIEGEQINTLAGHLDLSIPLEENFEIVKE